MGPVGRLVNGIALYSWNDGLSYNGFGVWENSAYEFLKYDLDICDGLAGSDDPYHRK